MRVTINLPVGDDYGWGICGAAIMKHMPEVVKIGTMVYNAPTNCDAIKDSSQLEAYERWVNTGEQTYTPGTVISPALNPDFRPGGYYYGDENIGYFFVEDKEEFFATNVRSREWDALVAGSVWNQKIATTHLQRTIHVAWQGVDPQLIQQRELNEEEILAKQPIYVFSGGKFEYRKGQDFVIKGFANVLRYSTSGQEPKLMYAWTNKWPDSIRTMEPAVNQYSLLKRYQFKPHHVSTLHDVLIDNGIPIRHTVPLVGNQAKVMGRVSKFADLAVFPNRAEGGTNLVAMECIAAGIPTYIRATTGQEDLKDYSCGTINYVDDIRDIIHVFADNAEYRLDKFKEAADKAAKFRSKFTWENTCKSLLMASRSY